MPQINRVRVNNVKYNFGTQFYDDFLMRFSCRNSIYDLANGGGKSVLMLLLLQNLIPNCTLDDKQPIEKLFRTGNASTTIHSLIEWKLDSQDVRDGYRYMTTGFCARKAKDSGDDRREQGEAANIEYFNYCIFYKEFGENDIKNLPLSNGKERITYNGLKAYLRDLSKKDLGVEAHVFERKGDYQNFIAGYGLYESQWEIIRGINKTEGHVRTYFETNYRTTRKVVEDLLIEEIIEKSYNNRIRKDSDDDAMMAKTLLEIKDKLTELAARREEIGSYDRQTELLREFGAELSGYEKLYTQKEELKGALVSCLTDCRSELAARAAQKAAAEQKLADCENEYEKEARLTMVAEIESEYLELAKLALLIDSTGAEQESLLNTQKRYEKQLADAEISAVYAGFLDYRQKYEETKALIAGLGSDKESVITELAALAAAKKELVAENSSGLSAELSGLNSAKTALSREYEDAKKSHGEYYAKSCASAALLEEAERTAKAYSDELESAMSLVPVVSAEGVSEYFGRTQKELIDNETAQKTLRDKIADESGTKERYINDCAAATVCNDVILKEISEIRRKLDAVSEAEEELLGFRTIYGASTNAVLPEIIGTMQRTLTAEITELKKQIADCEAYKVCVKNGTLPEPDPEYKAVLGYLKSRYGDDIVTGYDIVRELGAEELKSRLSEFPQLPYVIFAGDCYDEITADKVLTNMQLGSHIIPVLKKGETTPFGGTVTAYKCADFLWNEALRDSETDKNNEDLQRLNDRLSVLADKAELIAADREKVESCLKVLSSGDVKKELEDANSRQRETKDRVDACRAAIDKCNGIINEAELEIERLVLQHDELSQNLANAKDIIRINNALDELYARKRVLDEEYSAAKKTCGIEAEKEKNREAELSALAAREKDIADRLESMNYDMEVNFAPYLIEGVPPVTGLSQADIDAKASALRKILGEGAGNLSDKEALLETLAKGMKKCEQDIQYAGADMETAAALYETNRHGSLSVQERMKLKADISDIAKKLEDINRIQDDQNARKNRIEGGIEHARMQYEAKYGEFVRNEIDNPQAFIVSHRNAMSVIKEEMLKTRKAIKELETADRDMVIREKELSRAVENAGMDPNVTPKTARSGDTFDANQVMKSYSELEREELTLKNNYLRKKQILLTKLEECKAYELAHEFRDSLTVPQDVFDATRLRAGIDETIECIVLERDRIEKSLSDMELIKDSFENRCIQICSNIRTELDRLSKLSRITLDDEQISIVSLSVPYIAESMYKDRMSVYVNETVAGAETFKNAEEKLKYIRQRLSWKRLFSVIVTDMNSIRLNLYKREHIKDQSRYLKYEEAVGSTGQSQGIYIQFLIAIINYIASINAVGKDGSVTGKTIFIDNPFGAAKDVYIWEPIFKMLKTNHVQLIVPARGTTPAITGMFDVNYILGQKMVGQMQQTVVVDYRSQVHTEEMEYNPLDYEQVTFDFV